MVFDTSSVKNQFTTMSLRYYNHSRIDAKHGVFKLGQYSLSPTNLLALAKHVSDQDYDLKELFGEKGIRELKDRLEYLALLEEPVESEYYKKVYCNSGHFLCDLLKMGTYPRNYYDRLTNLMLKTCANNISLRQVDKDDYSPEFAIAIASTGSDLDAVIEILFGDQTLQVSTILIQEALKEDLKIKLSTKCATFLENGYSTGLESETIATANEAKRMGAKVGEFKSSSDIMAFVYDLLPLKSFKKGNVLFIMPFRTAAEAVKLAANVNFIAASVWGDSSIALSIAHGLKCNNVWINSHGLTHPGVPLYPKSHMTVPRLNTKDSMMKLLGMPEMEPYFPLIRRWTHVPQISLPGNRYVLRRYLGPIGLVSIPWRPGCEKWIIPALACGNKVKIYWKEHEDQKRGREFIELFSEAVPAAFLEIVNGPVNEREFVLINERKIAYRDEPSDHTLLTNLIQTQYIWFAEPQSL